MKNGVELDLEQICRQVCGLVQDVSAFLEKENKGFSRSSVDYKGLNNLVSYVDKEAEQKLVTGCRQILPQATFLTEEGTVSAEESATSPLTWIIDPLDGTTNFVHKVPVFGISVGLVQAGKPILGVVSHVPDNQLFYAWEKGGAWCNGKKIHVSSVGSLDQSLLATGFPYYTFEELPQYLNILNYFMQNTHGLRRLGSAAIDLAYVASGVFEGFFEFNLSPWDVAAGICLVREAGGQVSDFSGKDNALFGKQIVAAGPVFAQFQQAIESRWNKA